MAKSDYPVERLDVWTGGDCPVLWGYNLDEGQAADVCRELRGRGLKPFYGPTHTRSRFHIWAGTMVGSRYDKPVPVKHAPTLPFLLPPYVKPEGSATLELV